MKKILCVIMAIIIILSIETCAISFGGRQNLSYVNNKPILSNNNQSEFESNTVRQYKRKNSTWFDNDHLSK